MTGPYETSLTVPAGRPEDNPAEVKLEIEGDVVTKIEFEFPAGCCRLARVAGFYGIKQLWPVEAGTWFASDDYVISMPVTWDLPERKVTLTFKGWNEDDTYPHTITCRLCVEDMPAAKPWQVLADFILILKRLIGV